MWAFMWLKSWSEVLSPCLVWSNSSNIIWRARGSWQSSFRHLSSICFVLLVPGVQRPLCGVVLLLLGIKLLQLVVVTPILQRKWWCSMYVRFHLHVDFWHTHVRIVVDLLHKYDVVALLPCAILSLSTHLLLEMHVRQVSYDPEHLPSMEP